MSTPTPSNTPLFSIRSKSFWFACLFFIYGILSWFIVPSVVETQLKDNLKTLANWDTTVGNIRFNPYALSLTIDNAEIKNKNTLTIISFEKFIVNFSLIESITGTISFDEISLSKPFFHLSIDQAGITNFQHDFASDETPSDDNEGDASGEMISLFFDLISIASGKIHINDNSQGENFQFDIEPLSFDLENFSTHDNDGGHYDLSIALKNNQKINWAGKIGIAPFQSEGHLELDNINSNSFWHYAKSASPYWLNHALISLRGDYKAAFDDTTRMLSIQNAALSINDVTLSETAESDALLNFNSLNIAPISFDLERLSLNLGYITLDTPSVIIARASDHSLNILRPLNTLQQDETETAEAPQPVETPQVKEEPPVFHWNVSAINIKEGGFIWKDAALLSPAALGIHQLDLTVGKMSDDLSQAFPYNLSFAYLDMTENADSTERTDSDTPKTDAPIKQTIQGSLSPQPFALKGNAKFSNLELASLQSYLDEFTNTTLESGQFNLQSDYDLAMTGADTENALSGTILTNLSIDTLAINDNLLDKPLSGFKQFAVGPVAIALDKHSTDIRVESILLDKPYGDIFISKAGQINLSHITKNTKTGDKEHPETPKTETETETETETDTKSENNLSLLLKTFALNEGTFSYTDASFDPAFTTQLSKLSGTIENISTQSESKSKVAFKGHLGSHAELNVNGTLNPLSDTPNTDIKLLANNIDLTMVSPYAAKYAGYQIEKGKLNLDLSYLINDTQLTAENKVLLNQFEFGKSVDSPDATSLPLPLAIEILKDSDQKIDLNVPISGDLNDPSFKITSVILDTFSNIITRVVTSPFSMLDTLIEGGDDISGIQFSANTSELSDTQRNKINAVAKALKDRPKLTLEVRGIADRNIDRASYSTFKLTQLAKDRAQAMSDAVIRAGNIDAERVFILDPEIVELSDETPATSATSKFTLGIR